MAPGFQGSSPASVKPPIDFSIPGFYDPVLVGSTVNPIENGGSRVVAEFYFYDANESRGFTLKVWNDKGSARVEIVAGLPPETDKAVCGMAGMRNAKRIP